MSDLITLDGRPLAKTASAECSPELWRRLTEHSSFQYACEELVADDRCLAELRQVADRIEAHAAPCGPKAVAAELAPLVTIYGVADRSEGEWAAFWRFYTEALQDLPLAALRNGVKAYVAQPDSEFFPKPGPLKALCQREASEVWTALGRSRQALKIADRRGPSAA